MPLPKAILPQAFPCFPRTSQRDDGTLSSSHLNARHCVFPCPCLRLHRRTLSEGACARGLPARRHRGGQIYARRLCGRGACEPALRNRRDAPHVRRGPSFFDEGPLVGKEHRSPGSRAPDGDCDTPRSPLRALVLRSLMGRSDRARDFALLRLDRGAPQSP